MGLLLRGVTLFIWLFSVCSVHAADLKQAQWIDFMTQNLPALFCKPDQYYLGCYEITKEECAEAAAFAVEACIAGQMQGLPDIFNYEESRRWGAVIEKCVDQDFNQTFSNQKRDTPECKEVK